MRRWGEGTTSLREDGNNVAISPVGRDAEGGNWVIVDGGYKDRLVASCPAKDEAMAIAALLNGDPTGAWQLHIAYIALFDAMSRE
jgi:hypothetical protein